MTAATITIAVGTRIGNRSVLFSMTMVTVDEVLPIAISFVTVVFWYFSFTAVILYVISVLMAVSNTPFSSVIPVSAPFNEIWTPGIARCSISSTKMVRFAFGKEADRNVLR